MIQRYGPEIEAELLRRIAGGETLTSICKDEHMPVRETVLGWRFGNDRQTIRDGFDENYMLARQVQADTWSDELIDIADHTTSTSWQADRLRINTRQWVMGRLHPVRWGEGNQVDAGTIEHTVRVVLDDMKPKLIESEATNPEPGRKSLPSLRGNGEILAGDDGQRGAGPERSPG